MPFEDIELYKGKKFSDLAKDIVTNSENTKGQIDLLISDLRQLIKGPNDAIMIVPLLRDYIDIGIKNDDELVKLAAIAQRIISNQQKAESMGGDGLGITQEERDELMAEINGINKEKDVLDKKKTKVLNFGLSDKEETK
jgi:hypothetical protein